jgi:arginase
MNSVKIIKNRSDIGAGTRGSDMGIDALEIAAINSGNDYFFKYPFEDVQTHNETIYNKVKAPFAKRIVHVREQCERVAEAVKKSVQEDNFTIVLSGDHSNALGTMSGIKAAYPDKKLGVFWIDAHADLHSPFTSPSGNIHGMPLAAALSEDNLPCKVNEVQADTLAYWNDLKNIAVEGPKVSSENLVFFGVRDTEEPEDKLMERQGIKNYPVHEVRFRGFEKCVQEAIAKMDDCEMIYISFDVDSMDCDMVSYGTGTPVPKGFDPSEAEYLISEILRTGKTVCLEFTEVNPLLDKDGNKMAEVAFSILSSVTKINDQK